MEGLRSLLESTAGLRVAAAESSLEDAMDVVWQMQPTVMVVDKSFGVGAVLDWLRALRSADLATAAVVWSGSLPEAEAVGFLQAGAAGVVRKTASLGDLLTCIRTVAAGGNWMESEIARSVAQPARSGHPLLTARELQVMELIEQGRKNKDIALALGIRTGTVKIHVKHIFEKTGIRGRYGLAISGLREKGLITTA